MELCIASGFAGFGVSVAWHFGLAKTGQPAFEGWKDFL
jgi:hypothetical protein